LIGPTKPISEWHTGKTASDGKKDTPDGKVEIFCPITGSACVTNCIAWMKDRETGELRCAIIDYFAVRLAAMIGHGFIRFHPKIQRMLDLSKDEKEEKKDDKAVVV